MLVKRVMALLGLVFGLLGVAACLAGFYGVWWLGGRIAQTNEKIYTGIDKGLAFAQETAKNMEKHVKDAQITTIEITQNVRDWRAKNAKQRLAARLEIEKRAEKLASQLQSADSWLEKSTDSIRGVQHALELTNLAGPSLDPATVDNVFEKLTSMRSALQQAEQAVDGIREFTANKDGEPDDNRLARATKLLIRTVATIGEIDTRLDESVSRLSELRTDAQQLKERTSKLILLATIGCFLLLAWIAAGQVALCWCGWKNCC